jgi:phenylpyruvate tautomerase PptA (4-oxalocrotonate tautomerase family)
MPIMEVRYPAGSLDKAAKAALAKRLTDVLIKMEGGANTWKGRAFAWVLFAELAEDSFWVGGRTDNEFVSAPGKFLVQVTIPEGYMNAPHKSEVHAWVTSAIIEATTNESDAAANNVLVVIDEVIEGNWGAGGKTISLDTIAEAVGQPKDGPRFRWVRSYYEAKARGYSSAGYPPDVGGLLPSLRDTSAGAELI